MSTESPQAAAAGQQSEYQARLAGQLSGIAIPELEKLMGFGQFGLQGMLSSRDASGMMAQDRAIKSSATDQLNSSYGQAGFGSREAISYGGLRSGEGRRSPGAFSSATMSAATGLDRDRASALRNLEFQSAQSSLGDYNKVLSLLGQGTNTALGLAQGFSGAAGAAIGGLSNQSQFGNTMAGFGTGAALGGTIGSVIPGVGTVIGAGVGGVVGGIGGYLGGG